MWAFGLALVPLVVTNVVSLALAVVALRRSRAGGSQAAGFAVVALVVDVLVLSVWALVALTFAAEGRTGA